MGAGPHHHPPAEHRWRREVDGARIPAEPSRANDGRHDWGLVLLRGGAVKFLARFARARLFLCDNSPSF